MPAGPAGPAPKNGPDKKLVQLNKTQLRMLWETASMATVMRFDLFWDEYCADRARIFEIDQSAPPSAWDIEALERRVMGGRKPKVRKNDIFSKFRRWCTKRLKLISAQANQKAKKVPGVSQAQDLAAQGIAQASKLPGMDLVISKGVEDEVWYFFGGLRATPTREEFCSSSRSVVLAECSTVRR